MATSSLTEFKLNGNTIFSIYTKRGGQPEDISVNLLKCLKGLKKKKGGLEKLFDNFSKTIYVENISYIYNDLKIKFDSLNFIEKESIKKWNDFVFIHPECEGRSDNIDRILNNVFNTPEKVYNIDRSKQDWYNDVECHNIIELDKNMFQIKYYNLNKIFELDKMTLEKFNNWLSSC